MQFTVPNAFNRLRPRLSALPSSDVSEPAPLSAEDESHCENLPRGSMIL